jgi:hypothetical protein
MNTNRPDDDPPLDALLQEWKIKPLLPPRFNEQVWRRIEQAETAPAPPVSLGTMVANWIASLLSRPAVASAYVAMLLAIGAGVGWSQARQETARVTSNLSARYVRAVDPYQTTP